MKTATVLPMKWAPSTHQFLGLPHDLGVCLENVPAIARTQARNLLSHLSDDARWVAQPLIHLTARPSNFREADFEDLVEANAESPEGFSRRGWTEGLLALSHKYPEIPRVLWDTIAVMGLRPNADEEELIPNLSGILHHPWSLSDAALHGAAKTTSLWMDICAVLEKHSGRFPEHDCGCSHIFRELQSGLGLPQAAAERVPHLQKAWWEHTLSEIALIHVFGFPFALHDSIAKYEGTLLPAAA